MFTNETNANAVLIMLNESFNTVMSIRHLNLKQKSKKSKNSASCSLSRARNERSSSLFTLRSVCKRDTHMAECSALLHMLRSINNECVEMVEVVCQRAVLRWMFGGTGCRGARLPCGCCDSDRPTHTVSGRTRGESLCWTCVMEAIAPSVIHSHHF